jgi:4-aminobutyrate aminotransferase
VIAEEKLLDRSRVLGERLRERLDALRGKVPQIADVRGLGSMNAVEFAKPASAAGVRAYDADLTKRV